jgi:DNA mismatch repair protein MutS
MSKIIKKTLYEEYYDLCTFYKNKFGNNLVILMQVGAFYEMYQSPEDKNFKGLNLDEVTNILEITKTKKDKSKESTEKNPYMAGITIGSLSKYANILLKRNMVVVIIDQDLYDPTKRAVSNILTPSVNTFDITKNANYVIFLYIEINDNINTKKKNINIGMCAIDAVLSNVYYYESNDTNSCLDEATSFYNHFNAKELFVYEINNTNGEKKQDIFSKMDIKCGFFTKYTKIDINYTKIVFQNNMLNKIYSNNGILTPIEKLDLDKYNFARISLIAGFDYILKHNEKLLLNINEPKLFDNTQYMMLHNNAQIQLDVISYETKYAINSLNDLLNNCLTPMGYRFLQERLNSPYIQYEKITEIYDLTELILNENVNEFKEQLKNTCDIEKFFRKIFIKYLEPDELYKMHTTIKQYIQLFKIIQNTKLKKKINEEFSKEQQKKLKCFVEDLEELFDIEKMQNITFNNMENSFYKKGTYKEIDELQLEMENKDDIIKNIMNKIQNFDSEYKMKVSKNKKNEYHLKMSLKNGLKFKKIMETENCIQIDEAYTLQKNDVEFKELKNEMRIVLNNKMNSNDNTILKNKLCKKVFECYKNDIEKLYENNKETFKKLLSVIIKIDYILNNALNSLKYHYTKPILIENEEPFIEIKEMRHPLIERLIDTEYIPHNITINNENQGLMIYGKNSCGKSSLMKAIGLNLIMAQCGLYCSCLNMRYSVFKSIYTRISGNDNLFKGHSSFVVELNELKNILRNANKYSLIIGDEICRGTDHISATCIVAESIIKLINMETKFLFATHLHDLPKLEKIKELKQLKFYFLNIEIINDEIIFYRDLQEGTGESIYGIDIAKYIINDDNDFIEGAYEFKKELLKNMGINIEKKTSNYNSNLYMEECNNCGSKMNLETHHINQQKDFVNNIHNTKLHIQKNDLSNLVVLCDKCHDLLHNNKLKIKKKIKTSEGIKII